MREKSTSPSRGWAIWDGATHRGKTNVFPVSREHSLETTGDNFQILAGANRTGTVMIPSANASRSDQNPAFFEIFSNLIKLIYLVK